MMGIRIVFLIVLLVTLSVTSFGQTDGKNEAALKALVQRLADAQMAFDVKTLDSILTPDYIEISPLGEFDPRDKVLGFYKPEMKPPGGISGKVEFSEYSIRVYSKFAVVIVKETFAAAIAGKPMPPRSLRITLVCRRIGGEWKLASAQYTGIRPKQPNQEKPK
ncbi:MAG TPA: nuclear transport factor 2 family protein [Pyrinomonadaceae bacterium]|nr:nuclear transport factor 2 family protein [Pyrinomonadaceae bacterium]